MSSRFTIETRQLFSETLLTLFVCGRSTHSVSNIQTAALYLVYHVPCTYLTWHRPCTHLFSTLCI